MSQEIIDRLDERTRLWWEGTDREFTDLVDKKNRQIARARNRLQAMEKEVEELRGKRHVVRRALIQCGGMRGTRRYSKQQQLDGMRETAKIHKEFGPLELREVMGDWGQFITASQGGRWLQSAYKAGWLRRVGTGRYTLVEQG